jgi:hypothetical protein
MDHLLFTHKSLESAFKDYWAGAYDDTVTDLIVDWMKEVAAGNPKAADAK